MSIQQRIASDVYRMADKAVTPEQIKSIQAHLVKSVQTGAVPSYVGIPLLNDLNQKMARIQTAPAQAQAMVQQPPLAQQVMGQAEQGVETLPSGLPEQAMAGGGIVAFAGGGMSDYEMASQLLDDEDDEDQDYVNAMLGDIYTREAASARDEEDEGIDGLMATMARESVSTKQGDQPAQGVTRERTSVSGPTGLADLLKMIEQKESGGRGDYDKYGKLLTSSAGAQGRMQVMPGTARDPGFGIRPAREGDVEDLARVGREYYTALLDKYQDPKVAAIAYNWGPGNTDKWLSSGAGIDKLPRETRNYVANMREGGIAHFQNTGLVIPPTDDLEKQKDLLRRLRRVEQAKAAFSAGPAPTAAPTATPAATPAPAAAAEGNLLQRGAYNIGNFLGQAVKSPLTRGVGLASLLTPANAGQNIDEEGELARRRAMPPTITGQSPAGVATLPAAGAGRGKQGGPNLEESKQAAFEREVGATQDMEDFDAGLNALPTPEKKEATEAPKEEDGIRSILNKFRTEIGQQREVDNYLSLLAGGLGMMGGTSPFAAANIGQGALQGVKTYQQAAQLRGADQRGLLSAELGLKKYEQLGDIRRAQIAAQQAKGVEDQDIKRARLAQTRIQSLNEGIGKIEELAGKAVDATGKLATTEMLGKPAAEIAALRQQEVNKMLMGNSPMALRYKAMMKELGYDLSGFGTQGGNTMSSERAKQFKVER